MAPWVLMVVREVYRTVLIAVAFVPAVIGVAESPVAEQVDPAAGFLTAILTVVAVPFGLGLVSQVRYRRKLQKSESPSSLEVAWNETALDNAVAALAAHALWLFGPFGFLLLITDGSPAWLMAIVYGVGYLATIGWWIWTIVIVWRGDRPAPTTSPGSARVLTGVVVALVASGLWTWFLVGTGRASSDLLVASTVAVVTLLGAAIYWGARAKEDDRV